MLYIHPTLLSLPPAVITKMPKNENTLKRGQACLNCRKRKAVSLFIITIFNLTLSSDVMEVCDYVFYGKTMSLSLYRETSLW